MIPELSSRMKAAIWGQFIGDAAALGSHWIYDLNELARFPGGVIGFEAPKKGHYHEGKLPGDQTHYGDSALLLLESLAACGGDFRENDFGIRFAGFFGSPYCKSYKDHATRITLEHLTEKPEDYQNGAEDDQAGTVSRIAPLAVTYHSRTPDERQDAVRRLTQVTQNHTTAIGCAQAHTVLIIKLLDGTPFETAFEATRKSPAVSCDGSDYFEFAHMLRGFDVTTATGRFGQSCPLPQSFTSALHAALKHHDDFQTAILATLRAGGDSAARASMIGAWLGAIFGMEGLPQPWLEQLRAHDRIQAAMDQLFSHLK